ncbi:MULTISPECIES: hypothetical protein [Leuconostoc]|mgnify:CR=1 FL=1|uniref:Uncharacterized protein n=1 Tax=Leuconostoc inhae TaxID=178001 RepID=A0AAN2QUD4_9LACO|nr:MULTISPECIES: hypothetical protein [Leuconostoc]MBZ5947820.1 hypothetical protein [Leuconostoc gasicomitatum]MBZ5955692.1 hypothetical protein [Leuconostoc gasicomitatum]MBZ5960690.1 hypothetical protein [Leuconostoc gasicomitatum]MBZ5979930.1 hypothetical protein [Leuconostoc gasicomitatum]MBZ5983306.1 hypothetical protein [Leuconostoc gasicomitatum]
MKNEEIFYVLGQVMLKDSASEQPEIRQELLNIKRKQLRVLLVNYTNDLHGLGIEMDYGPYKAVIKLLDEMTLENDFDQLMDHFFAVYEQ